jgi:hypothetical protein
LIASNVIAVTGLTENVPLGMPIEYVEAYAPRAGFVHPRDELILWAHSVTIASTKLASV